jgi:two-component system phosphate regulon response regulator OmpR
VPREAHVLVVDDEAEIREMLREFLSRQGLAVSVADGGAAMREVMAERPVDLVILDLRMPGEDGLTLARSLRAEGGVGIVMLTAAGEPIDRVVGLEVGADDYLAKPFDPRELLARVRSVLRRVRPDGGAPATPATSGEVRFGRCVLNLDKRKLYALDGSEVPLTAMEFDLMKLLAANPSRVLTRDELLEGAHNRSWEPFDRSIDIRIWRLRQKVEPDPSKPEVIKTIRGGGYMFVPAAPGRG